MENINDFNKYINDLVSAFNVNHITTYSNTDDGLEARIMEGNDRFNYRVVVRDTDADETITVRFCDTYSQCAEFAKTLFVDGYIIEQVDFNDYVHECAEFSEYVIYYGKAWALVEMVRAYNSDLFYEAEKWATVGENYVSLDSFITSVAYGIIITAMTDAFNKQGQEVAA